MGEEIKNNDEQTKLDKKVYELAREFLSNIDRVPLEILDKELSTTHSQRDDLATIYRRILESARNRGMSPNVVKRNNSDKEKDDLYRLESLLCRFQPTKVLEKYNDDWHRVLNDVETQLNPPSPFRRNAGSIWPQFCKTIVSGAAFMAQFETAKDFCTFVDFFNRDDRARAALPMLLSKEIDGFGFPLACDFLKEIGYLNFGKPDVHVKEIFFELKLSKSKDDYKVFKAIQRVAKNVDATPFKVDKMFWLAGSGDYLKKQGKRVRGDKHRKEFIDYVKNRLIK